MFESCYNAYDTECIYDVLLLSFSFTLGFYAEFKQIVLDYATEFAKMKSMRSTHNLVSFLVKGSTAHVACSTKLLHSYMPLDSSRNLRRHKI